MLHSHDDINNNNNNNNKQSQTHNLPTEDVENINSTYRGRNLPQLTSRGLFPD